VHADRDIFLFSLALPVGNEKANILTFRASPEKEGDNQFCYGGWLRPRLTIG
jgi:hypothetical protein